MRECNRQACSAVYADTLSRCPVCGHGQSHWVPDHQQIRSGTLRVQATWSALEEGNRCAGSYRVVHVDTAPHIIRQQEGRRCRWEPAES